MALKGSCRATDSYGGLCISSHDTDEFRNILKYIRAKAQHVAAVELQAQAEAVLSEAEAGDLEALFKFVRSDDLELPNPS